MKKTSLIALFALTIWACHRKTVAPATTATPAASNEKVAAETAASAPAPAAAPAAPAAPSEEMLAAGKTVYTTRCNRCHEAKPLEKYSTQQWEGILKAMIPKARLNETEAQHVTAYVMANAKK